MDITPEQAKEIEKRAQAKALAERVAQAAAAGSTGESVRAEWERERLALEALRANMYAPGKYSPWMPPVPLNQPSLQAPPGPITPLRTPGYPTPEREFKPGHAIPPPPMLWKTPSRGDDPLPAHRDDDVPWQRDSDNDRWG